MTIAKPRLGADASHRSLEELYRLLSIAPAQELRILVGNTPAQPFLESGNERSVPPSVGSIFSSSPPSTPSSKPSAMFVSTWLMDYVRGWCLRWQQTRGCVSRNDGFGAPIS